MRYTSRRALVLAILILLTAANNISLAAENSASAPSLNSPSAPPRLDQINNLIRLPLVKQTTDYTCGVASLRSVLLYYGEEYGERELAKILKADPVKGTGYQAILKFSNRRFADPDKRNFKMRKRTGMTIDDLKEQIDGGRPVIILIQAWAKPGVNWGKEWKEGHYVVVVGYDKENIYLMDPALIGHYAFIPIGEFLVRWHDVDDFAKERLIRFGLVIENHQKKPSYDADALVRVN
jgi:uncharacterized protein YvpB